MIHFPFPCLMTPEGITHHHWDHQSTILPLPHGWLVVWNVFYFSRYWSEVIFKGHFHFHNKNKTHRLPSQLTFIFFRGVGLNHQPDGFSLHQLQVNTRLGRELRQPALVGVGSHDALGSLDALPTGTGAPKKLREEVALKHGDMILIWSLCNHYVWSFFVPCLVSCLIIFEGYDHGIIMIRLTCHGIWSLCHLGASFIMLPGRNQFFPPPRDAARHARTWSISPAVGRCLDPNTCQNAEMPARM